MTRCIVSLFALFVLWFDSIAGASFIYNGVCALQLTNDEACSVCSSSFHSCGCIRYDCTAHTVLLVGNCFSCWCCKFELTPAFFHLLFTLFMRTVINNRHSVSLRASCSHKTMRWMGIGKLKLTTKLQPVFQHFALIIFSVIYRAPVWLIMFFAFAVVQHKLLVYWFFYTVRVGSWSPVKFVMQF